MAQISVAAAGNAEKNVNLINARFQAEALRRLRGYDTGVLDNSFYSATDPRGGSRDLNADYMWKLSAANVLDIAVGRGMATAYGYDLQSENTVHLTATPPATGDKYLFVYLQWDLSNPVEAVGSILIYDNGGSTSWSPSRQDNLITNPMGVYQMPLYRLKVNTSGTVTARTDWTALGGITIGNPLRALYAGRAEDSDRADYASGRGDKKITDHFTAIYDRLDKLGFKTGVASISNSGTIDYNSLKKQGVFVVFSFRFWFSEKDVQITIPEGFRPYENTQFQAVGFESGEGTLGRATNMKITIGSDGRFSIPYENGKGQHMWWVDARLYSGDAPQSCRRAIASSGSGLFAFPAVATIRSRKQDPRRLAEREPTDFETY